MLIIFAAGIDLDKLNDILRRYDMAAADADRDRIADEAVRLIRGRVQSMLRNRLRGLQVAPDELNALAEEAIRMALEGSGRTRLKRRDIVPEEMLKALKDQGNPYGARLWDMLPQDFRKEIEANPTYIKSDVSQKLVNELNRLMADPLFLERIGISDQTGSSSAIERSREHAEALKRLFPGAILDVSPPSEPRVMGYMSEYVIPEIRRRLERERGSSGSAEQSKVWRRLEPLAAELQAQLGRRPTADEVHELYKQRLQDRYGPIRAWWEEQLRQIGRPFPLKDPKAYSDAKQILSEHGYDENLWLRPDSSYYLPKEYLKPIGLQTISRALEHAAPQVAPSPRVPVEQAPAAGWSQTEVPSWVASFGGLGGDLYRLVVEQLYAQPQFEVERAVGELLATDPSGDQVDPYLSSLDPSLAAEIREMGWDQIAREVDSRVLEFIGDEGHREELAGRLGLAPQTLTAGVDAVRRVVFCRKTKMIRFASTR